MLISSELFLRELGGEIQAKIVDAIKDKQVTKYGAVNASGKLANSIRFETTNNGERLVVYAEDYIDYLVYGRSPGKRPPKDVIRKWIDDKGLEPIGISKDSLAYLIARKIGNEGTEIYKQGGSNLLDGILTFEMIQDVRDKLQNDLLSVFTTELLTL